MELANRESRSSWRDFLSGLKERGLFGVEFVVSDDHEGLKGAIREVFPGAAWQRFEIGCDNGERVRIALTLDCCDREAISWVATTGGINSADIRDLMIESVERRFGLVNKLLTDRMAVGQRLALHRRRNPSPGAQHRPGAVHDADPKSPVERHGRSLRQIDHGITRGSA